MCEGKLVYADIVKPKSTLRTRRSTDLLKPGRDDRISESCRLWNNMQSF